MLTTVIAVDDNQAGMECEIEEDTPAMVKRVNKPPVYPRAKSMVRDENGDVVIND